MIVLGVLLVLVSYLVLMILLVALLVLKVVSSISGVNVFLREKFLQLLLIRGLVFTITNFMASSMMITPFSTSKRFYNFDTHM